jgi:hypothetical protein
VNTPCRELLVTYHDRTKLLKAFYTELTFSVEQRVNELAKQNNVLISTYNESFPDLKYQFFKLDTPSSTHFRIVNALGVSVVVLNATEGFFGALIHLHNNDDLQDISFTCTIEDGDAGPVLMRTDKEYKGVTSVEEISECLVKELLLPTVTMNRIKAIPQAVE